MDQDFVRLDNPKSEEIPLEELIIEGSSIWIYFAIFSDLHWPDNSQARLLAENYGSYPFGATARAKEEDIREPVLISTYVTKFGHVRDFVTRFLRVVDSAYCRYDGKSLWRAYHNEQPYTM